MTDWLQQIAQRYRDRDALLREAQQRGRGVIGYVGLDVPEEMILAAGLLPVRLEADVLVPADAANRIGSSGHPVLRALVAELLAGRYRGIDRLVIGTTPRFLHALNVLIAELHGIDADFARFDTCVLDVARGDTPGAGQFNATSYAQLRQQLAVWSGREVEHAALAAAIACCNDSRVLLARFSAQRRTNGAISGAAALEVHACANSPDRGSFNDELRQWLTSASTAVDDRPTVLYSGTATDSPALYRRIEAQGLRIIDDDQDFGARATGPLVGDGEPLAAIVAAFAGRYPAAAGWSSERRRQHLLERVAACRPDGVLFHIAAYDHPGNWDYPLLRAALDDAGVPHRLLDAYTYRDPGTLDAVAADFARALRRLPAVAS